MTRKPRRVVAPDREVIAMLRADIVGLFGDVTEMLWPHEVGAVQRWLKEERALWGYGRDALPDDTRAAFEHVRSWLFGQAAAARAYQRKQLALPTV